MKGRTKSSFRVIAIAALAALPLSQAQAAGYFGVGGGVSSYSNLEESCDDVELRAAFSGIAASCDPDDSDSGFKVFGGYRFNENWAIEGSIFDLGTFSVGTSLRDSFGNTAFENVTLDLKGVSLAAVSILPVGESTTVFAKLGAVYGDGEVEAELRINPRGIVRRGRGSDSQTDALLGAGLSFNISEKTALRLEWERFFFDDEIDFVTLSFVFGW